MQRKRARYANEKTAKEQIIFTSTFKLGNWGRSVVRTAPAPQQEITAGPMFLITKRASTGVSFRQYLSARIKSRQLAQAYA